ncbi:TniQ family protein [Streptomyces anulatus]|uniref:TniQ family protein n=1 Tax=Streptomyces anulatus TaxID=1892 RepID=UPI0036A0F5FB
MENTGGRVLPRSLSPLEGESLPGYVLRLAHRVHRSPARIGYLTGLIPPRRDRSEAAQQYYLPGRQLVALDPRTMERFAAAARLTPEEAAALGMANLEAAYPPLARATARGDGRVRQISWSLMTSSRFCPRCLLGDGSPIQRAHGGAWQQRWHLPVIFACTRHQRLLESDCSKCRRPVCSSSKQRRQTASFVLHPQNEALHPSQCRNKDMEVVSRRSIALCGNELTAPRTVSAAALSSAELAAYLAFQRRIERRLENTNEDPKYFEDLITIAQLIKLSWPKSLEISPMSSEMSGSLDLHMEGIHRKLTEKGSAKLKGAELTSPPHEAISCAALLLQAETLRSVATQSELYLTMQTLADIAFRQHNRRFLGLIDNAVISTPLTRALAPQRQGFLTRRTRRSNERLLVPTFDGHFTTAQVPQIIPLDWYQRHLEDFTERLTTPSRNNATFVRRAASLKLVQMASGNPLDECSRVLEIPVSTAKSTLAQLRRRCADEAWGEFQKAVEEVAHELDKMPKRVDFLHRRQHLADWEISDDAWLDLTWGLPILAGEPRHRKAGSVIVWTCVTEGDRLFCPLVRTGGIGERHSDARIVLRQTHAYFGKNSPGEYAGLRRRLHQFAEQIATRCDADASKPGSTRDAP